MGFRPEETHYKLQFENEVYKGLEVTVAEVTTGELCELLELVSEVQGGNQLSKAKQVMQLFDMLGGSLIEWNLEDRKGNPVPATAEGVKSQTLKVNLVIVEAWISAMAEVEVPLENGSSDGETSLEQSIQMEVS